MGIARHVETTAEFDVYAQSPEDFLNKHAAFDNDVEFSLNLFLRAEYGVDLAGNRNTHLEGVFFEPDELIYTYDNDSGRYVKVDKDLLQSSNFMNTLQRGMPYFVPSVDKNGNLDFTNPKIIKVSQYKGESQLFIMGDRQLRYAEAEFAHVEKPTAWQRFADGFLKIFGSRNAACENYEKFQAMMESTLKGMHKDYEKVKAFALERQEQERLEQQQLEEETREIEEQRRLAQESYKQRQEEKKELTFADVLAKEEELWRQEQQALQEQQVIEIITWPEYTRQAPKYIKRNMSAEEFEQVLKLMLEEGGKSLKAIVDEDQCKINHEALVAVTLYLPVKDFLKNADASGDREKFLLENQEAFLLQIDDFEKQVREIDLSLVDDLFSRDFNLRYEPGVTVGEKLKLTLEDLNIKARNIYHDHLDKIKQEQEDQERQRQEEERQRQEEERLRQEEKKRQIEEAERRRAEALAKNPYGEDDLAFYMNDYKPVEEFAVPHASVFLKSTKAAGDFPAGKDISSDFPEESKLVSDFPAEDSFGGMNDTSTNIESDLNPNLFVSNDNQHTIINPFDDPFSQNSYSSVPVEESPFAEPSQPKQECQPGGLAR